MAVEWIAELSDNSIIKESDFKVMLGQPKSWHLLVDYIRDNNLYVRKMWLESDGQKRILPEGQDYYSIYYTSELIVSSSLSSNSSVTLVAHYPSGKSIHLTHDLSSDKYSFTTKDKFEPIAKLVP